MSGCSLLGAVLYIYRKKKKKLASWFIETFEVRYSGSSNMNVIPLLQ